MGQLLNLEPWLISEDQILAGLLGLTVQEYRDLSHSGIREVRDMNGHLLYYYLIVSPLNTAVTLSKLNMSKSRMIYLPPDFLTRRKQLHSL